jgi:hypothetical protein
MSIKVLRMVVLQMRVPSKAGEAKETETLQPVVLQMRVLNRMRHTSKGKEKRETLNSIVM